LALAADRVLLVKQTQLAEFSYPVQTGARVFRGSIVALCSDGTIVPAGDGAASPGAVAIAGIAEHVQDNTASPTLPSGQSGPGRVRCRRGCFALPFDTAPTAANFKAAVYAVDDQTVTLTASGHLAVGTLAGFDENGVPWVQV
jgi:hypothetical protein